MASTIYNYNGQTGSGREAMELYIAAQRGNFKTPEAGERFAASTRAQHRDDFSETSQAPPAAGGGGSGAPPVVPPTIPPPTPPSMAGMEGAMADSGSGQVNVPAPGMMKPLGSRVTATIPASLAGLRRIY